ncbi:hypothetical protein FRB94_009296 [Tulasnella sp. JGI-2019a]|nr:hypothetical protein FRB94_009296 [Tulasnella sp. JGI-2019a]
MRRSAALSICNSSLPPINRMYTIKATVFQTRRPFLDINDVAVHCDSGTWDADPVACTFTLKMKESGTSGALLYRSSDQDACCFVLGIHNYKPWCNVVTNIAPNDTASSILNTFYGKGFRNKDWEPVLHDQNRTSKGTEADVRFFQSTGNSLTAVIKITGWETD